VPVLVPTAAESVDASRLEETAAAPTLLLGWLPCAWHMQTEQEQSSSAVLGEVCGKPRADLPNTTCSSDACCSRACCTSPRSGSMELREARRSRPACLGEPPRGAKSSLYEMIKPLSSGAPAAIRKAPDGSLFTHVCVAPLEMVAWQLSTAPSLPNGVHVASPSVLL